MYKIFSLALLLVVLNFNCLLADGLFWSSDEQPSYFKQLMQKAITKAPDAAVAVKSAANSTLEFLYKHREDIVWALKKLAEGLWYVVEETAAFVVKQSEHKEYLLIEVKKTGDQFLAIPDKLGVWFRNLDGSAPIFIPYK